MILSSKNVVSDKFIEKNLFMKDKRIDDVSNFFQKQFSIKDFLCPKEYQNI